MSVRFSRELWATCLFVVAADQITKILVLAYFAEAELLPIIPGFFNLTLHYNPGVAFGVFADIESPMRGWVIAATTTLALGLLTYLSCVQYAGHRIAQFALGLILGGAVGNIIDRVRFGKVVDFLDFYIGTYHWPAFNVADSVICVGVGILLIWGGERRSAAEELPH